MKAYKLWMRISNTQTAHTLIYADYAYIAKKLGEAEYGVTNVLNHKEVSVLMP
jgi:hypothetical protein